MDNTKRNIRGLGLLGYWLLVAPALAGLIIEPEIHWIGPEANCDYPSIQEALDDIFDCGLFACPQGTHELRLSDRYSHSGQVVLRRSFDVRGGFPSCQATFAGSNKTLSAVVSGLPLFAIRPGGGTIRNVLRDLRMVGNSIAAPAGGVISMEPGNATLRLEGSIVTQGNAASGGGVHMAGGGNRLELVSSIIEDSKAVEGGGVFCTNGGVIDFQSGRIEDNMAERSGGGVQLQSNCRLIGKTSGSNRQILRNTVTDSQRGQGGGIYALGATIDVGALNSRTRIEQNQVSTEPLHDYDAPGDNRGGGVHLEFADGTFYNTWFRGNAAADGGAISAAGGSNVLVDRYSGPCDSTDTGNSPDCSLFEFNRALGGKDEKGDEGGDGAMMYATHALGVFPVSTIRRSVLRFNMASCPEEGSPDGGECDFDGVLNKGSHSTSSVVHDSGRRVVMQSNLVYGNDIGDHENCLLNCRKFGILFASVGDFYENTVSANADSDFVFGSHSQNTTRIGGLVNNVIWEFGAEYGAQPFAYGVSSILFSSCNISNFPQEFDLLAESIPEVGVDADPLFRNPDLNTGPGVDFRVEVPDSPAIDRCDDQEGRLVSSYDIVGNPRPINIRGVSNGPGQRDAGAFESIPAGYVNDSTDLIVNVRSELPQMAEVFEPHNFVIEVVNTGRNSPAAFSVDLRFDLLDATLESLTAPNNSVTNEPLWDCNADLARCRSLSGLAPGATTVPITAVFSFASQGLKAVTAEVAMQDGSLDELTPDENFASDSVTVGPGADLSLDWFRISPDRVPAGGTARFLARATNNGPEFANDVRVRIDLSTGGGQVDSFEAPGWDCNINSASCTLMTPLPGGPDVGSFVVNLRYASAGRRMQGASVSAGGGTGDPNPGNNSGSVLVDVFELADALFRNSFED